MSTYAVVDLSNLFNRARHGAMADPETKVGLAMLIVFRSLRKMHRDFNIDHIVFAVDQGSWRYNVYPEYKSRRKLQRATASLAEQKENALFFDALKALITYLDEQTRCTVLRADNVEGDDFVARWVARHPDDQHIIVSGDSDFVQLIAPNVRIYDAINQRMIGSEAVVDEKGRRLSFTVNPKDGKVKVGAPDANFEPEHEWWRKALFIKLLRGDTGDSIFAAYPGVRYEGKKVSIRAAWEDRYERGYDWNNLMGQTWSKLTGTSPEGEPITEMVCVADEFAMNQLLIDLTMQPYDVVDRMDATITETIRRKIAAPKVGFGFVRFCTAHDQPALLNEAADHVTYLNAAYPKTEHATS